MTPDDRARTALRDFASAVPEPADEALDRVWRTVSARVEAGESRRRRPLRFPRLLVPVAAAVAVVVAAGVAAVLVHTQRSEPLPPSFTSDPEVVRRVLGELAEAGAGRPPLEIRKGQLLYIRHDTLRTMDPASRCEESGAAEWFTTVLELKQVFRLADADDLAALPAYRDRLEQERAADEAWGLPRPPGEDDRPVLGQPAPVAGPRYDDPDVLRRDLVSAGIPVDIDDPHWRLQVFSWAYRAEWQPLLRPEQRAMLLRVLVDLDVSVAGVALDGRDLVAVRLDDSPMREPELLFDRSTGWRVGTQVTRFDPARRKEPLDPPVAGCPLEPWIAERTLDTYAVVEEPGQVP
ncbi:MULTISPECIES: hypothetical protein [Catenuloplanes]|uniref:CU044_5270 family protein n=1 Tax=Catenuloplanes niger TaxID=587534 RepID=A0AAE4CUW6_9ACTN|nr:hypothetical protein [Catenuloplanes niger]MDR7324852.1 hypothetical protein [Catenuloplanes niger]